MSEPLQPHELQHVRFPYPSLSPKSTDSVMPSNHLISCHLLLCLPSIFPSVRSFLMSQFFPSGQSIGASASVLPKNEGRFPLGLTDLISLLSKGLSRILSSTTIQKHQCSSALSLLYVPNFTSVCDY